MRRIQLWSVLQSEAGQLKASSVQEVANTETEERLEDLLVASPDLLLPGLVLIGRQLPTDGGPLDLLGIDEQGRLVLFELKRGTLTREAVAQSLDYASDLAQKEFEDLERLIEHHSGSGGINPIDDFSDWYAREYPDAELAGGVPRIVLVGLGVDDRARRIVNFLAETGIDIQLLTFHAFSVDGQLFLARQVETKEPTSRGRGEAPSKEQNRENLHKLAEEQGVLDLLVEASDFVNTRLPCYRWPGKTAYSFSLQERTAEGKPSLRAYVTLYVNQKQKGQLTLSMPDRVLEVAPEAVKRFLDTVPGATLDESRWPPIQADFDRKLWEGKLKGELERLLHDLEGGWKARLDQLDESEEVEEVEDSAAARVKPDV